MRDSPEADGDLDLIQRATSGDPVAFTELVNHYATRLRWLIRLRLDPAMRARLSADDVLQETMLVVSKRITHLAIESEPAFWSWLCRVVEQRLIDARRRHLLAEARDARREQPPMNVGGDHSGALHDAFPPAAVSAPSARARTAEQRQALERALHQLPESFREVIVLRVIEGLSVPDTARIMNRSRGAVSVLLTKAVKRLSLVIRDNPEAMTALTAGDAT